MNNSNQLTKTSLNLRRLVAVILYDLIIIIAILALATSLLLFTYQLFNRINLNPHSIFFRLYLASIIISYYHICWRYAINGQSIGMKAWKVKLINNKCSTVTISQSTLRIVGGIVGLVLFGLGYFIMLFGFNKQKISLADYLSDTKLTTV